MVLQKNRLILFVLAAFCCTTASSADSQPRQGGGHRQGPPQEAYAACEGKNSGDTAQFVSPRGDTVNGTCEQEGNRLVLRPDRRKRGAADRQGQGGSQGQQQRGGRSGPPPEAYAACEGKNAGDRAEFESPRGDKVSGTCEPEGDMMVLRPDRRPER